MRRRKPILWPSLTSSPCVVAAPVSSTIPTFFRVHSHLYALSSLIMISSKGIFGSCRSEPQYWRSERKEIEDQALCFSLKAQDTKYEVNGISMHLWIRLQSCIQPPESGSLILIFMMKFNKTYQIKKFKSELEQKIIWRGYFFFNSTSEMGTVLFHSYGSPV